MRRQCESEESLTFCLTAVTRVGGAETQIIRGARDLRPEGRGGPSVPTESLRPAPARSLGGGEGGAQSVLPSWQVGTDLRPDLSYHLGPYAT